MRIWDMGCDGHCKMYGILDLITVCVYVVLCAGVYRLRLSVMVGD